MYTEQFYYFQKSMYTVNFNFLQVWTVYSFITKLCSIHSFNYFHKSMYFSLFQKNYVPFTVLLFYKSCILYVLILQNHAHCTVHTQKFLHYSVLF